MEKIKVDIGHSGEQGLTIVQAQEPPENGTHDIKL